MMVLMSPETWPFGAALATLVGLTAIEGTAVLFAQSPSPGLDGLGLERALGWLHLGRVPILVLLILFLAGFSVSGYAVQAMAGTLFGSLLPWWLASLPAALTGMCCVRAIGGLLARLLPDNETTAVSEQSLVGRTAMVTQGIARTGMAAQTKVRDASGGLHYVLVEPDIAAETFAEGDSVLLVRKTGARYYGIRNPHPELL
jgi:hypothetical protein